MGEAVGRDTRPGGVGGLGPPTGAKRSHGNDERSDSRPKAERERSRRRSEEMKDETRPQAERR